jgi:hypothetical protein
LVITGADARAPVTKAADAAAAMRMRFI